MHLVLYGDESSEKSSGVSWEEVGALVVQVN